MPALHCAACMRTPRSKQASEHTYMHARTPRQRRPSLHARRTLACHACTLHTTRAHALLSTTGEPVESCELLQQMIDKDDLNVIAGTSDLKKLFAG